MSRRYTAALREVRTKSDATLERETARKWADRAIAACHWYREKPDLKWVRKAWDWHHEALEHAALVGDGGKTVAKIQAEIDREMSKCGMKVRKR